MDAGGDRPRAIDEIRDAGETGQLAFGYLEEIFPSLEGRCTRADAAEETGLEPALIERILTTMGLPASATQNISENDMELLRYAAAVHGGLTAHRVPPARARLRPGAGPARRRRGAALSPLCPRAAHARGRPGTPMAEEMEGMARELLPLTSPMMDLLHKRLLAHFIEQDVIGHTETTSATARPLNSGVCGSRSPSRTSRDTRASSRRSATSTPSTSSSGSSSTSSTRCPRTRGS